jgi:hypothetical protein
MKCATAGCPHEAQQECTECSRKYCNQHVETCSWCQEPVCLACRDEHQANNPMHDESARTA